MHTGHTKTCGCGKGYWKHGKTGTTSHKRWIGMVERHKKRNTFFYSNYGSKGITVCDRWLESFENFYEDMGECPEGYSLDRIDNDKGYYPGNCRWATWEQQSNNTKTVKNAKGYYYSESKNKYVAAIYIKNKHKNIGYFDSPEEAHNAYLVAKKEKFKELGLDYEDK